MKRIFVIAFFILSLLLIWSPARAEPPTKESMMDMIELSGALEMMQPMLEQLRARAQTQIKHQNPNMPEKALTIINEEMQAGVKIMVMEILAKMADYYSKHLTQNEVDEIITIYKSPAWKKYVAVGKQYLADEYVTLLQVEIPRMTKELLMRVFTRLENKGLLKNNEKGA
ncbi:DUF2059 domain-containing protein [Pseudodesulfovibrio sediminis]|uniref:DUF2059 domain-containing protein n=1 Tax=Pseudodesulfovibrio sediminis TaxID=2810563 RepID=A0ABM7P3K5_9BACT|nr:DUF2059 domain-containing protein [Pseudodesulfovibrio sediminis]BCS87432.1 hypothetical protein PSDVSF_06740 [Pseudodesulfovibrio sediminis]